jgi:phosphatidylglycerol:prolipoprotein diacylglycerol transferase
MLLCWRFYRRSIVQHSINGVNVPVPNTSTAWVHNLDPFLVQFGANFGIRWYGLAYLTGFVVGALLMMFIAIRGRRTLSPELITDYITYVVLGTMIGGRVGYAVFYSPDLLTDFSGRFPFWGVLRVWEGGMASHGGMIGILLAAIIFARRHKLDWLHLGDLTVLGGSVGIFFGRIANFINGELFGRPAGPGTIWPVKFPGEMYLWLKHDTERRLSDPNSGPDLLSNMTEAVKALGTSLDQWTSWITQVRTNASARYEVQVTIEKIIHAIQSGNEQVRAALGMYLTPRHPSQLYEALMEGLLMFLIAFIFWRKPRKPGVVGSVWLTCYAIVRIIGEQFRMPDAHIGFQLFGLTRGQWLSIVMLIASLGLLVWTTRRQAPLIAGWGREAQELKMREP